MEIFLTSPWIPPEWIKAHGLEPRGIWSATGFGNSLSVPGAGACAFAQSVLQIAESKGDSAVIFASHCDQLRRAFDAVPGPVRGRTFLFNLPATAQTALGTKIFAAELERLGNFLVRLGGQRPGAEELRDSICHYDITRQRLLEAAPWCPSARYAEAIHRFYRDGSCGLPDCSSAECPGNGASIPVGLVGGPLPADPLKLLEQIENAGGRVVLNATEPSERTLGFSSRGTASSPCEVARGNVPAVNLSSLVKLLAQRFSQNCADAFVRPNDRLYEWLRPRLAARSVRGIVLHCYGGCDLWRAEAQNLRETFQLPLLMLETESGLGPHLHQGRIEAFLEALR